MLNDRYGNPVSTCSRAALAKYDAALDLIRLSRGDPIAALDAAIAEDPDFGGAWAARAGLLVLQTDKFLAKEIDRSLRAGAQGQLNDRDRAHLAAAQKWAKGHHHEGTMRYGRVAQDNPRDLLAAQYAHTCCFLLGMQNELRDWPLETLQAFNRDEDCYGPLLGMVAFGHEECGEYARAEDLGREAVALDPRDGWSVHAVAHVYEMRGEPDRGISWLTENAHLWGPGSNLAAHNWWHLALFYLDQGDFAQALNQYDEKVRPDPDAQVLLDWIDASSLLWRLRLEGIDLGDRFAKLASVWERAAEDGIYAFNDLHALLAFLGAGRGSEAERTLRSMRRAAEMDGDNRTTARQIGVQLGEAFIAFEAGQYAECVEKIFAVRPVAQRLGGSHAQRDIFALTALHAAVRGGMRSASEFFTTERLIQKPQSRWAQLLAQRARRRIKAQ